MGLECRKYSGRFWPLQYMLAVLYVDGRAWWLEVNTHIRWSRRFQELVLFNIIIERFVIAWKCARLNLPETLPYRQNEGADAKFFGKWHRIHLN